MGMMTAKINASTMWKIRLPFIEIRPLLVNNLCRAITPDTLTPYIINVFSKVFKKNVGVFDIFFLRDQAKKNLNGMFWKIRSNSIP